MIFTSSIWKFIFAVLFFLSFITAKSQYKDSLVFTNRATLLGIGGANLYDTYLSPLEYKGTSFYLMDERMRKRNWFKTKLLSQQTIEFNFAVADNPAKNASYYWLKAQYGFGAYKQFIQKDRFRLFGGLIWKTTAGVLYNTRNGNNPASGRLYSNLNISAMATYRFKDVMFRWQMDTPVLGLLFSPNYGQSYYEISLGNSVGLGHFASFHNQKEFRNYLTVDFPVKSTTIRVGYLGSFYQTKVNYLQTHTYTNNFVIGWVFEKTQVGGKKALNIDGFY